MLPYIENLEESGILYVTKAKDLIKFSETIPQVQTLAMPV